MAKRPSAGRPSGGDSAFVKVTGKLASWLGFKASSGRYIARETLAPLEEARQIWEAAGGAVDDALDDAARLLRDQLRSQTVSNRQRATQSLRHRTGEPAITREKHAQQIKSGERQYTRNRSKHLQKSVKVVEKRPAQKRKLIVVQPGGGYRDVMAQGSDITKILARNNAMAAAKGTEEKPADFGPLNAFKRRHKRHYVIDADTGERVDLIMSREDLDRSKEQMNAAIRDEIDKRYAEDMAEV
jgi:hypothetical protein